jgi:hypothetical protein
MKHQSVTAEIVEKSPTLVVVEGLDQLNGGGRGESLTSWASFYGVARISPSWANHSRFGPRAHLLVWGKVHDHFLCQLFLQGEVV